MSAEHLVTVQQGEDDRVIISTVTSEDHFLEVFDNKEQALHKKINLACFHLFCSGVYAVGGFGILIPTLSLMIKTLSSQHDLAGAGASALGIGFAAASAKLAVDSFRNNGIALEQIDKLKSLR